MFSYLIRILIIVFIVSRKITLETVTKKPALLTERFDIPKYEKGTQL